MSSDPKTSVVLVGGGTIAPLHAEYLTSSPTCKLVAVIDPFPPGERLAKKLGVPHYASVGALLAAFPLGQAQPDAYVVCVPSHLHVTVASEILTQAKPKAMLVEKPLAVDSASAAKLLSLARQTACPILVGHHRRFHPSVSAARDVIVAGRIGRITAVSALWTTKKSDDYFELAGASWRSRRSAGGGPIWTNMVHDIDALHYLTGSRVVQIWATATQPRRERAGQTEEDKKDAVEEGAAIMARFADGTVATFLVSDNTPSPFGWESASGDNPDYAPAAVPVDTYRILGTRGTLTVPDDVLWTYEATAAGEAANHVGWNLPMTREALSVPDGIPFQRQTEHLGRVVRGLEAPICSGEDGLAAVQVCEAILQALEAGDGIPVNLPA